MLRHLPKNAAMQRLDLERSARQQHVLPEDRVHQSGPRQRPRFRQQRPNTASKNNKVLLIKDGGLKRTHVCIVVAAVYCGLHSVVRLGCPSQPLPVLLRTDVVFPMSFLSFPSPLQYKGPPPHPHPHPSPAPSPRPPSPPTPVPPPPTPPYPFQDHTLGWTARIANFVSLLNVRVFPLFHHCTAPLLTKCKYILIPYPWYATSPQGQRSPKWCSNTVCTSLDV